VNISTRLPDPRAVSEKRKWTVLVWSACDNDLYDCCVNDLNKAEQGSANQDIHVLAQVDHRPNTNPLGPHTVQRLQLQPDGLPLLHSPVKADLGDSNMADPKNLSDFIKWGIKNYPAEKYWVIISDHGDGWRGANQDDGHHSWMSLPQIESALKDARQATGEKLDVLSFDCCHMASAEVAHQLQNEADFMLGSEEAMGYIGLPYEQLLGEVSQLSPQQLVERVVESSKANPDDIPTFSAVNLSKIPQVTQSIKQLAEAICTSTLNGEQLKEAVAKAQTFDGYSDLHDFSAKVAEQDPALAKAAKAVQNAIKEATVSEQHSKAYPGAHGLQIEVNPDSEERSQQRYAVGSLVRSDAPWRTAEASYTATKFDQATNWSAVIEKINS
jgi:hypothetical protein